MNKGGQPLGQKWKIVMLPSPDQNLKTGSIGIDFFFFFFYVPWESWDTFSNIFFKVSQWGKTRAECSQNAYTYKCFFKPLNTNFSKFFAQIWLYLKKKKKKKKKNDPVFSHFTVGRERAT